MESHLPFICGKENELSIEFFQGLDINDNPIAISEPGALIARLLNRLPAGLYSLIHFLSNGARYYPELGQKAEWATPECDSFEDVVDYEIAGEMVALYGLNKLVDEGLLWGYRLHRRVRDTEGHVWGDHLNLQIPRYLNPADKKGKLQPALLTLQAAGSILLGGGLVTSGGEYLCSQKAFSLEELASKTTTKSRPMVNTRDEPYDDKAKYRRLHMIGGDANVLPWSMLMRIGVPAMVVRMVIEGVPLDDLILKDALYAGRAMAADPDGTYQAEMEKGKNMTSVQILAEMFARAKALSEQRELPAQEVDIIDMGQAACEQLEFDRDELFGKSDMVTKQYLVERARESRQTNLQAIDLEFGIIGERLGKESSQRCGTGVKLRHRSGYDYSKAETAVTEPPTSTRAYLRGRSVKCYHENPNKKPPAIKSVSWPEVRVGEKVVITLTARQNSCPRLEKILAHE